MILGTSENIKTHYDAFFFVFHSRKQYFNKKVVIKHIVLNKCVSGTFQNEPQLAGRETKTA